VDAVFTKLTVRANVEFGLAAKGVSRAQRRALVESFTAKLDLSALLERPGAGLHMSEMQRVAMARVLITKPALLLLDEPMSNLDADMRAALRGELKALQKAYSQTVFYVTQIKSKRYRCRIGSRSCATEGCCKWEARTRFTTARRAVSSPSSSVNHRSMSFPVRWSALHRNCSCGRRHFIARSTAVNHSTSRQGPARLRLAAGARRVVYRAVRPDRERSPSEMPRAPHMARRLETGDDAILCSRRRSLTGVFRSRSRQMLHQRDTLDSDHGETLAEPRLATASRPQRAGRNFTLWSGKRGASRPNQR
jgi:hypothetical protein